MVDLAMTFSRSLDELPQLKQTAAERMVQALHLYDEGVAIKRLSLKRLHPEANAAEIEALLDRWLQREGED